jgi:hypothetical protein
VAADSDAALHRPGDAGVEVAGAADDGAADDGVAEVGGDADGASGLPEPVPDGVVVVCVCGALLGPHAVSIRAAAAAAVDTAIPWKIF